MALPVIPNLKIVAGGLFDVSAFKFTDVFAWFVMNEDNSIEYKVKSLNLKELLYLLGLQNLDMLKDFIYQFYSNEGSYYRIVCLGDFKVFIPENTEMIEI